MSPLSPHTAETIAGYKLIERIGAGGYGEVWKAEAPGGFSKAVKLVYGYLDDQRAACERKALNRVKEARHPFLLSLERVEVVDGQLIVVTELADKSLKDRFDECRNEGLPGIPRDELLIYMGDAADALDYMRACHGLQHLDVKPENLLITSGRVKVADFGLVKSLQDDHNSLLGGLTPQYAPPELFDGSPSTASDQYSLAIVYQEMLTGTPPFPGQTAAQLASQHLHSQPRLTGLSEQDRNALSHALAKKPADRFACCHDLVDALRGAEALGLSLSLSSTQQDDPRCSSDTNSISGKETHLTEAPPAPSSVQPASQRNATLVIAKQQSDSTVEPVEPEPVPCELPPAADPECLPPIELAAENRSLVPSLVLGIGGMGADILRSLRTRILRDEISFSQANLEFLLLDTDSSTIESACGDRSEDSLEFRETLHLPLRPSADYREQSNSHLQWLSRRWLYNIPRSLRTEGRRPLGRLAFTDHVARVKNQIREALVATSEKIALGQVGETSDKKQRLRVLIVASVSGGTGGGIVPDIGYLVRQVMDELELESQGICALLTHATNSNHDQQELAIANAYACLSEVNYFNQHGYPGDPSCGLQPSDRAGFDHTYLVHLGDELGRRDYRKAVDEVAEYLYLNVASPAGAFFDAARSENPSAAPERSTENVRTFGLIQFDPHHNEITSLAVEELSRCVVAQWLGGENFFEEQSVHEYLQAEFPELKQDPKAAKAKRKRKPAKPTEHKTGLQYLLDPDSLHDVLTLALEEQLGGNGAPVFREWIKLALKRGLHDKRAFLKELDRSLGAKRRSGDETGVPLSNLEQSLADSSARLAVVAVEGIREALCRLTSNPEARIAGAQKAAQWLCDRIRQLERAISSEWTRIEQCLSSLEKSLPDKVTTRGSGFWGGSKSRGNTWIDYCQLRANIIVVESIARFVRRVNTHLAGYREQMKNTQFALGCLSGQFASQQVWLDAIACSQSGENETKSLSQSIGRLVESSMPEMVARLDQTLGNELIQLESSRPNEPPKEPNVHRFARALRAKSWTVLFQALRELDLSSRMFDQDADSVGNISDFLPQAVPKLPKSGGRKRLLVVAPKATDTDLVRNGLQHCEQGQFSLVQAGESELALCYELQDLNLPVVATRLTEYRENCILAAGRLHTRIDVSWPSRMTW